MWMGCTRSELCALKRLSIKIQFPIGGTLKEARERFNVFQNFWGIPVNLKFFI